MDFNIGFLLCSAYSQTAVWIKQNNVRYRWSYQTHVHIVAPHLEYINKAYCVLPIVVYCLWRRFAWGSWLYVLWSQKCIRMGAWLSSVVHITCNKCENVTIAIEKWIVSSWCFLCLYILLTVYIFSFVTP